MIKVIQRILTGIAGLLIFSGLGYGQMALDWVKVVGGKAGDHGIVITTDKWGNVYSAGFFNDTVDFDPGGGQYLQYGRGNNDVFLTKYDALGNFLWARTFGNTGTDQCAGLKTDVMGNVHIAGQFSGAIDLNPGGTNGKLTAMGTDVFVAKYDSSGVLIWAKRMGGTGQDIAYGLDVDVAGNVYTTGEYEGSARSRADFDPGPDSFKLFSQGNGDIFVSKLDAEGNFVWAKSMGGPSSDYSYGIAVDKWGNVYTTGAFQDSCDFDPGPGTTPEMAGRGSWDIFISKLDSMGNYVWAKGIGDAGGDFGYGIAVSDSGYVYTTGYFQRSVDFNRGGNVPLLLTTTGPASDLFVVKHNAPDGKLVWAKRMGGSLTETGRSIDLDLRDNVYVGGWFNSIDGSFNPNASPGNIVTKGGNDIFITKLNFEGLYQWGLTMGGGSSDFGYGICTDESGNVYTTGYVQGRLDFDPGADSFYVVANTGNYDFYVHKLICTDTNSRQVVVDVCAASYTYNGVTYTESGNYVQQFVNYSGCDSFFYLNLIIRGDLDEPVINVDGFVLSTVKPYTRYQWLKDDVIIAGATSRNYTVQENGRYIVVVESELGCKDTSEAYNVTNYSTAVNGMDLQNEIRIFPNPARDILFIDASMKVSVEVADIAGRGVRRLPDASRIYIGDLAEGIYLLTIRDGMGRLVKKERICKVR